MLTSQHISLAAGNTFLARLLFAALLLLATFCRSYGEDHKSAAPSVLPVSIDYGNRRSAFGDNLEKFKQTPVYRSAKGVGIDLKSLDNDLLVCRFRQGSMFYLFYNNVKLDTPKRKWAVQRIRKTIRDYATADGPPKETVTYQVEAFKLLNGQLKKPDQHFGRFGLRELARREIIKEYEVGVCDMEGEPITEEWPFDPKILFKRMQPYQVDAELYDKCKFQEQSLKWRLSVSFDSSGSYKLSAPELKLSSALSLPVLKSQTAPNEGPNGKLVLLEGAGVGKVNLRTSKLRQAIQHLGKPVSEKQVGPSHTIYTFAGGFTITAHSSGGLSVLNTLPAFKGRTSKGAYLGMTREKLLDIYGEPKRNSKRRLSFEGVLFQMDDNDQVKLISIVKY